MHLTDEDYKKALAYATEKHKGQFRIGGKEYITHPVAVAEILKANGFGLDYRITGLFHDLLEDTDATEKEISEIGGAEVLKAVKLLTKEKGYNMEQYVKGIKSDKIAFAVKCADRLHNLTCATEANEEFKRKYILETIDWYWDFSLEIKAAAKNLAKTLKTPMAEFPLLYENDLSFKI